MSILEKMFTKNTLTYIANSGVMITTKTKKIIIDGIIGKGDYRPPQDDFAENLVLSKEPYHNIDYIFVTHSHKDHIDASTVNELLKRNRHVKVIGPTAVKRLISSQRNFNDVLLPQIMTIGMKKHSDIEVSVSDISFTAYRLPHDGIHHSTLENLAYYILADGLSVTFLGDSSPRFHDFEMCDIPKKSDILICPASFIGQKSGREILSSLKPKHLILCHIKDDEKEFKRVEELCGKYKKDLPNKITVLKNPGEVIKL